MVLTSVIGIVVLRAKVDCDVMTVVKVMIAFAEAEVLVVMMRKHVGMLVSLVMGRVMVRVI